MIARQVPDSVEPKSVAVALIGDNGSFRERLEAALLAARLHVVKPRDASTASIVVVDAEGREPTSTLADPELASVGSRVVACLPPTGIREVRKWIERGVDGLVWAAEIETTLVPTVLGVAAGQVVVPRSLWRRVERPELTNREKQALSLVIMGLSNGEIARKLYVSESTVKSHLSAAFRKLGVASRSEAARVVADPREGLGTGILAITTTSSSGPQRQGRDASNDASGR